MTGSPIMAAADISSRMVTLCAGNTPVTLAMIWAADLQIRPISEIKVNIIIVDNHKKTAATNLCNWQLPIAINRNNLLIQLGGFLFCVFML